MHASISRSFRIEAARHLPRLPPSHPCARLHGHSFLVELTLEGEVDPALGWLVDYDDVARAFDPIRHALDHRHLNLVDGLDNPTSEHIARWIFDRLAPVLPLLVAVSVMETSDTRATYRPRPNRSPAPPAPPPSESESRA
jgi:6-pyruvoyltetrahydropterin/6-carboxytetrahydropterin synthase